MTKCLFRTALAGKLGQWLSESLLFAISSETIAIATEPPLKCERLPNSARRKLTEKSQRASGLLVISVKDCNFAFAVLRRGASAVGQKENSVEAESPGGGKVSALPTNGISRVNVSTQSEVVISRFTDLPELGKLILIDPETDDTLSAGIINFSLRRSENVHFHEFSLNTSIRENLTGCTGAVLWFTGLSRWGKSTMADHVSRELTVPNRVVVNLDGDNLRHWSNSDLGSQRLIECKISAELQRYRNCCLTPELLSSYR